MIGRIALNVELLGGASQAAGGGRNGEARGGAPAHPGGGPNGPRPPCPWRQPERREQWLED